MPCVTTIMPCGERAYRVANRAYHMWWGILGSRKCTLYVYMVPVQSSTSLSSSSAHAQHRITCAIALSTSNRYATPQLAGSMSHCARNTSPHTHWRPAIPFHCNKEMPYDLRPRVRKPARRCPLLMACHDALPSDILRRILLMRVAMPHRYPLRSRLTKHNVLVLEKSDAVRT